MANYIYEYRSTDNLPYPQIDEHAIFGINTIWRQIRHLFQILSPRMMKYELLRLATLLRYPRDNKPDIVSIAAAGFYSAAEDDVVVCYCCGVTVRGLVATDRPIKVHYLLSGLCTFFERNQLVNRRFFKPTPLEIGIIGTFPLHERQAQETTQNEYETQLLPEELLQEATPEDVVTVENHHDIIHDQSTSQSNQAQSLNPTAAPIRQVFITLQEEEAINNVSSIQEATSHVDRSTSIENNDNDLERNQNESDASTSRETTDNNTNEGNNPLNPYFNSRQTLGSYEEEVRHILNIESNHGNTSQTVEEVTLQDDSTEVNTNAVSTGVNNGHVERHSINRLCVENKTISSENVDLLSEECIENSNGNVDHGTTRRSAQNFESLLESYLDSLRILPNSVVSVPSLKTICEPRSYNVDTWADAGNFNTGSAMYPNLESYEARLSTFNNWPRDSPQCREEVADAGFAHKGQFDIVYCHFCGKTVWQWEHDDDPWIEHAKVSPNCRYVVDTWGKKFCEAVRKGDDEMLAAFKGVFKTRRLRLIDKTKRK